MYGDGSVSLEIVKAVLEAYGLRLYEPDDDPSHIVITDGKNQTWAYRKEKEFSRHMVGKFSKKFSVPAVLFYNPQSLGKKL